MTTLFQTMRLMWIDAFVQTNVDPLRRRHICAAFDISNAQAALDMKRFHALFPGRLTYDATAKGYLAAEGSSPVFPAVELSGILTASALAVQAHKRLGNTTTEEPHP
ncbi:hypothetical protein [uncultured Martelella sp.]|uniref:hypothetical protein n=1 Tax=uncultured Martelella sp. TaxID=392331 RepID=UPI0029C6F1DB|nr:hypothetical protein [uncultured Martelella sp.]